MAAAFDDLNNMERKVVRIKEPQVPICGSFLYANMGMLFVINLDRHFDPRAICC
jgi:hypothetical protein